MELLLLLHILVLSTANLFLLQSPDRNGRHHRSFRWAVALQPGAAVCAVCAFFSPRGWEAGLFCIPYLLFTALLALFAARRFLMRKSGGSGFFVRTEAAANMSCLFLTVGAAWMAFDRFGVSPGKFSPTIVLLTGIHFHFAGSTASLVAALCGRLFVHRGEVAGPVFLFVSAGVIAGPILTAVGIATSPLLEVVGSFLLVISMLGLALCLVASAALPDVPAVSRLLLLSAAAGLSVAMGLALLFAYGEYAGRVTISIPDMVRTHGVLNAGLFGAGATLAFLLIRPPVTGTPEGIPFSRLRAGFYVGHDFFERSGLCSEESPSSGPVPRGLCDSLNEFEGNGFNPDLVDGTVRQFYERTAEFELLIRADWSRVFSFPGRVYKRISRRMGQMNFPLGAESPESLMDSRILPLRDEMDGRTGVRAWVRTYRATGESIYAAAYSHHSFAGRTFMNIAFPLFGGNLTSILRLSHLADGSAGIALSSLPPAGGPPGDEGIYFVLAGGGIRLPMNEVIHIRPRTKADRVDAPGGARTELLATHDMFLLGLRFLSLRYYIHHLDGFRFG